MTLKHLVYTLLVGLLLFQSLLAASFSNKYDEHIKKATNLYWADFNYWKYWKAQLYQESRFNTNAVSPVGAMGLAQFMPGTWKQISKELHYPVHAKAFIPRYAIYAGAYYMRKLRNSWNWKRPLLDKHYLALASYNAGLGNILKSQKMCNNALLYGDIIECLPKITGEYSKETIDYVRKIKQWHGLM